MLITRVRLLLFLKSEKTINVKMYRSYLIHSLLTVVVNVYLNYYYLFNQQNHHLCSSLCLQHFIYITLFADQLVISSRHQQVENTAFIHSSRLKKKNNSNYKIYLHLLKQNTGQKECCFDSLFIIGSSNMYKKKPKKQKHVYRRI